VRPGCAAQTGQAPASHAPPRVVAYVASWSIPALIHAEKLTHLNFAFANIDAAGHVGFARPGVADGLKGVQALRKQNPNLKIIVSIGGWQAEGFSDAALNESSRQAFARSVVDLIRQYELDGIDLDWEYPGQGVAGIKYRAEDRENFTLLVETLREQLDIQSDARKRAAGDRYLLTIAGADREYFDHVQMDKLHVYLDWINVMSYDFFNSLTPTTGHHAGLFQSPYASPTDRYADGAVRQYVRAGVPAEKIVLGVAFYGRGFAGVTPINRGVNQPYTRYDGEHSYAELTASFVGKQGFVRYWDTHAQAPFLWNAASRTFITYDDPQSIEIKAHYVTDHRLGGMMFWELSQDRDGELLDVITRALVRARAK
jgi:chitinase